MFHIGKTFRTRMKDF